MKKIYLSLLFITLGIAVQAQRTIQVQVKIVDPAPLSELNIISSTIISPSYTIMNMGPDSIRVGDTIKFQHTGHGFTQNLLLWYTAPIPPGTSIALNKVVMGPTWDLNFDSVKSLYKTDLTAKLAKPFAVNTKYAWFAQVVNIVPEKKPWLTTITLNPAGSSDTVHVWIDKGNTSIGEVSAKKESIKTYPNPAGKQLFFDYNLAALKTATATVLDALGKVVFVQELSNKGAGEQQYTISTSGLQSGQYFLRLNAGEKNIMSKFSVQ